MNSKIISFECCECDNEKILVANGMEEVNNSIPETRVICEECEQEYLVEIHHETYAIIGLYKLVDVGVPL